MKKLFLVTILAIATLLSFQILSYAQCDDDPIDPALEIAFEELVEAIDDPGVVYLTVINGDTPNPNACGLNPSNNPAEWAGWGGPLEHDNMSIGEGPGTRNLITIAGVRYERGIGTHAAAKLVYDLTGRGYEKFMGVAGIDDEKTCGTCQVVFSIDDEEVFDTDVFTHSDPEGVEIEFDIPSGAQELLIDIQTTADGNGCDHADLGDARLMTSAFFAVNPAEKLASTWGGIKIAR